ncbi:hypothetical protein D9M72_574890 [compost metagenome]
MSFINKNNQFRLSRVALFRHGIVYFGQKTQHESGEKLRLVLDVCQADDVHVAFSVFINPHQVIDVERHFAKEKIGALLF